MSSTAERDTEREALYELQKEQSKLLDKIDELRTIGVGGLVDLPQLVVCGNQSSGKSSVLEAISRIRFPAKSNVCTRFAMEVILRRRPFQKIKIAIEPGPSRSSKEECIRLRSFQYEVFANGNDLPTLVKKAEAVMGISEVGFSDDVLKIEISGPDKPELTLVDLPGLYTSTSKDQGAEGKALVRSLTEKYIRNSRSIILAVISAKTDYHLQEILNIAEGFDPDHVRTLGIITQPDILEVNSDQEETYLSFLENKKLPLGLGWHALCNRSFETRGVSDVVRDKREKKFFNQGRWASVSRDSVGISSLRRHLSSILLNHIHRSLPGLIADINEKVSDHEQQLSKLGPARSNLQQQRGFLLSISSGFERITGEAVSGMYVDKFFDGPDRTTHADENRRLRAVIRQLNEFFAEAMAIRGCHRTIAETIPLSTLPEQTNPYLTDLKVEYIPRSALEAEVSEQARKHRGIELPGSANQLLVGSLFRDQSQPWEDLAKSHLMQAWESVTHFVSQVLLSLADEHTYSALTDCVIEPALESMKLALIGKLDELTAHHKRGHPLPVGRSFLTQIQKARSGRLLNSLRTKLVHASSGTMGLKPEGPFPLHTIERAVDDMETSRDEFAAAEIIDQMQAYYDTAIVTFVDNVAILGIENCLLEPLQRIFTSQTINNMGDQQVRTIATEPTHIGEELGRLTEELQRLRNGLRTFSVFKPLSPPTTGPSIYSKSPSMVALNNPTSSKSTKEGKPTRDSLLAGGLNSPDVPSSPRPHTNPVVPKMTDSGATGSRSTVSDSAASNTRASDVAAFTLSKHIQPQTANVASDTIANTSTRSSSASTANPSHNTRAVSPSASILATHLKPASAPTHPNSPFPPATSEKSDSAKFVTADLMGGQSAQFTPFVSSGGFGSSFGTPALAPLGGQANSPSDPHLITKAFGELFPVARGGDSRKGTGKTPFKAFTEKDEQSSRNMTNHYQSITFIQPYRNDSFEELRLGDYNYGRRYGNGNQSLLRLPSGDKQSLFG